MIIPSNKISQVRENIGSDTTLALRFGCYDIMHNGHIGGLQFAADQADALVVGVVSDERVRNTKGPERPIHPLEYRIDQIDKRPEVEYSFVMPDHVVSIIGVIRALRPDTYVEHIEYGASKFKKLLLTAFDIDYVIDRRERVESSTSIIDKLGAIAARQYSFLD